MRFLLQMILVGIGIVSLIIPGASCNKLFNKRKNFFSFIMIYGINIFFTIMLHRILRGHFNYLYTLEQLWALEWTYTDIIDLLNILSGSLIFSCFPVFILCVREKCQNRERRTIKLKTAIVFTIAAISSITGYCVAESSKNKLVINEVASKNTSTYLIQNEGYCDYIEFYNTGNLIYHVKDLYVSDDVNNLKKIELAECQIEPGEFLLLGLDQGNNTHCIKNDEEIVWYSPENGSETLKNTSFVISEVGEYVYLSDKYGNILEEIYTKKQGEDIAFARVEDGQQEWQMQTYTPGESNSKGYVDKKVTMPKLSHKSGFYERGFELEIIADSNVDVYYTLDGSDPCEKGILYKQPIYVYDRSAEKNIWNSIKNVVPDWKNHEIDETPVDKAFIIKAVAKDKYEKAISDTICATYFIDKEEYRNKNIVSLIADPEDLFGDEGIFVTGREYDIWYLEGQNGLQPMCNWDERGRGSEVGAELEIFGEDLQVKDSIGIRVQGGSRRTQEKKSLAIFARNEYGGSKWLKDSLYHDFNIHSLQLRTGNANAILHCLVKDRAVDTQEAESVVVFLNGEYWENTYLQDRLSESYFEEKYGLGNNSIDMVKDGGRVFDEYIEVPMEYTQIYDFLENEDLAEKNAYEKFIEMVDIDSYIDFSCINLYWANMDWTENKNYVMWRAESQEQSIYGDGKWRWALYDLDAVEWGVSEKVYGVDKRELINPFTMNGEFVAGQCYSETPLYMALRKNPEFCKQMVNTFMDLMNHNFSVENVDNAFQRWGLDSTWNDSFFVKRSEHMIEYIKTEFELQGNVETLEVEVNDCKGGTIRVNSICPNLNNNSWSGKYFTDYPLEVEVVPSEGYKFVKWSGDIDSEKENVQIEMKDGGTKIVAIFEKE